MAQFVESEIRRLCEENQWAIGALNVQGDDVMSDERDPTQELGHVHRSSHRLLARLRLQLPIDFPHTNVGFLTRQIEPYPQQYMLFRIGGWNVLLTQALEQD